MWTVLSQKKHDERLGEQQGLAYIRAKAQLGVVSIGEACAESRQCKAACAISRNNHNLSCGSWMLPLTTRLDERQCSIRRQVGWQLTPSS